MKEFNFKVRIYPENAEHTTEWWPSISEEDLLILLHVKKRVLEAELKELEGYINSVKG